MDVFEALRDAAGDVFADRPVTFAYLFGSMPAATRGPTATSTSRSTWTTQWNR